MSNRCILVIYTSWPWFIYYQERINKIAPPQEIYDITYAMTHYITQWHVPLMPSHLVVVVLRGAARVKLEVEVPGPWEGHCLLELVVVPDGVDGLHQPTQGPGRGDLDGGQLARAAVEESTCLGQKRGGGESYQKKHFTFVLYL